MEKNIKIHYLYLYLLTLVLLPSVLYGLGASSLAAGLFLFIFATLLLVGFELNKFLIKLLLLISIIVIINGFMSSFSHEMINFDKFFYSLICFLIMIITAAYFPNILIRFDELKINLLIINFTIFFVVIYGLSLFVKFPIFFNNTKNVIFFSEPSHFGLSAAPFILYSLLALSKRLSYILILIFLVINFYVENLTILFILLLSLCLLLKNNFYLLIVSILLLLFFYILDFNLDFLNYYIERIILVDDNLNMSHLVYLSGWERAYISFLNTSFFGVGFQQFGYNYVEGFFYDKLISIGGDKLNIYDGGSLGSKFVAEFGLFALLILLSYIVYLFKLLYYYYSVNISNLSKVRLLFYCIYITFFVDLFIRGTSYFSDSSFLFIASLFYFYKNQFIPSSLKLNVQNKSFSF